MIGMADSTGRANFAMVSLAQGIGDIPYGFAAIANNIQQVTQGFALVQREAGGTKGALKELLGALKGPTGIFLAVSVVTAAITYFSNKLSKAAQASDGLADSIKDLHKEFGNSQGDITAQIAKLQDLTKAYFSNKGNLEAQANIKQELTKINKTYASQLGTEIKSYKDANTQLKQYQNYLIQTALIKAQSDQISKIVSKENEKATKGAIKFAKELTAAQKELAQATADMKSEGVNPLNPLSSAAGLRAAAAAKHVQDVKDAFAQFKQTLSAETFRLLKPLFEQIYDSTQKLASITNPFTPIKTGADEAVKSLNKLSSNLKDILPQLPGQSINAGPTKTPGVPTHAQGSIPSGIPISDPDKLQAAKDQTFDPLLNSLRKAGFISDQVFADMNQKLKKNAGAAQELAGMFDNIFSTIANGGDPFKALIQSVEQLILKLGVAIATVSLLNIIPGGSAVLKALDIASKVTSFAGGGFVPSPQLAIVGDAPGGEWVLNQRQISAILNGSGGGREIHITGEFRQRGNDLVAVVNKTINQTTRRNGSAHNPYK